MKHKDYLGTRKNSEGMARGPLPPEKLTPLTVTSNAWFKRKLTEQLTRTVAL